MSEQASEQNPAQVDQSQGQPDQTAGQPQPDNPPAAQPQVNAPADQEYPLTLVKRLTGDVHWNTAKGIWETIVHGETGEPNSEYALVTTVDGEQVTLASFNTGGIETQVRSAKAAKQQSGA